MVDTFIALKAGRYPQRAEKGHICQGREKGHMSRKRRREVRRRISGPLAAALLFVFIFEHLTAPFSYATSPDMASASNAIQSGKVTWTDRPEEDVQIAVLSDAASYGAGDLVCLDVYIKNNTADEITDGFLNYTGSGIEKDRESTYFEDLSEGVVWEPVWKEDAGAEAAGIEETGAEAAGTEAADPRSRQESALEREAEDGLGTNGSGADTLDSAGTDDQDLHSGVDGDDPDLDDADAEDGDDRDPDGPDVLTDLTIAPGQSYHVQFYYTIQEDLRGTRSQNVEFTFRWKAEDKTHTSKQTFRYVVGAMNLLPVEIMSAEQAAGTEGQLHAGERGQMLLDFDLGDVWEIIEERLEENVKPDGTDETAAEANETGSADTEDDGSGEADAEGSGASDAVGDGSGETDTAGDGSGASADAADPSQEETGGQAGNEEAIDPSDADAADREDAGLDGAVDPGSMDSSADQDADTAFGDAGEDTDHSEDDTSLMDQADGGQVQGSTAKESAGEDPASHAPSIEITEAANRQLVREPAEAGTIEAGADVTIATPSTADREETLPSGEAPEEDEADKGTASPSTAEPKPDDQLDGLVKWEDDPIGKGEKPVIKDISCSVETYGIKLKAFRVAGEDEEADSQSTSVRCTFRVDEETEPGIYYGNVTASYRFKNHTFRSTQGFLIVVSAVEDGEVAEVIRLIDELPEQEEVEEAFAAYDLAEDEDGRDAYYMELYGQVMEAYRKYQLLSAEQQEKIYNRDKLMAYEWLWGGEMLAAGEVTDWEQLKKAIAAGQPIITLANDIDTTDGSQITIAQGKDITLDLNGHELTYTGEKNDIFLVSGSFTIKGLTNDDSGGTILGKNVGNVINVASGGKVWIKGGKITTEDSERAIFSRGTVNIEGGAISGNRHKDKSGKAGGIWAHENSVLNISGGSIDHNSAGYGGGIYTTLGAEVNISGGTIAYNEAIEDGGGICDCHHLIDANRSGSTINITGGSIEHNEAQNGGGIYINSNDGSRTNITIKGGTISDNTASKNGGGIYAYANAVITVSGGDITNNSAKIGGGIAVDTWCEIDLSGGNITDNKAEGSGGGIALSNSTIGITGGTIQHNIAQGDGGGIAVITNGTINLDKGTIKENTAQGDGGGIVFTGIGGQYRGFFMKDGEIFYNTAAGDGGGVAVTGNKYRVEIDGGKIEENRAGDPIHEIQDAKEDPYFPDGKDDILGNGGGIYIEPKRDLMDRTPLMINGGSISVNRSYAVTKDKDTPNSVGGGGIFTGSDLTITGGEIKGNYAAEGGGGILFYYRYTSGEGTMPSSGATRPEFKMSGGTISENVAVKSEGGGLYFQGVGEITGGRFTDNESRTIYDYGGGGIFIMTNATLKLYNALITDNFAEGYGGGLAGCAKSNVYMFSVKGGAIYGNTVNGDQTHLTLSKAGDEKVLNVKDFGQKSNGSKDYFCSGKSVVYDHMLGGGHQRWSGFCDGETMMVPLNGFVKTKVNSEYADNRDGKGLMGLTAGPTAEDIAKVASVEDKVIITGNKSNTHGGGVSSNGVLYLGEGTGTDWEPSAEKTYYVNGQLVDLTKDQFTFVMLDKEPKRDPQTGSLRYDEQSVVSTATNNEKGEIRFRIMADRAFSPEDFTSGSETDDPQEDVTHDYTFYMIEKADANGNVRYDTTVYKIDVTMQMHVQEEEDVQDNITSYVKIYSYVVAKDSAGKDRMTVTAMRPDGSEIVDGDAIEFANFWIETPPSSGDGDGNGGGGGDEPTPPPPTPTPPSEKPPIIPSDDTGNGTVVEIIEEKIEVPIFALPDAQLPDMPEQITLFENGVPRGYVRVWNPDTQQWEWIPEDEVPLGTIGLPKAGDDSHPMLWLALFFGSIGGIVILIILRKKSVQEQAAEDRKQSESGS